MLSTGLFLHRAFVGRMGQCLCVPVQANFAMNNAVITIILIKTEKKTKKEQKTNEQEVWKGSLAQAC